MNFKFVAGYNFVLFCQLLHFKTDRDDFINSRTKKRVVVALTLYKRLFIKQKKFYT